MKILKMECRRAFFSKYFLAGIVGVVFSYLYSIYKISGISISVYSTYEIAIYFIPFVLSLTFSLLPHAQSLCEDMENKYIKLLIARAGIKKYMIARMATIALSAVLTMILGTIIFILIVRINVPWIEAGEGIETDFFLQIFQEHYFFYFVIRSFFNGLLAACMAVGAAYASLYWQSRFFVLSLPFLVYSVIVYFANVIFAGIPQLDLSQCFIPSYDVWNNKWISAIWPIGLTTAFVVLIINLGCKKLRRIYYETAK